MPDSLDVCVTGQKCANCFFMLWYKPPFFFQRRISLKRQNTYHRAQKEEFPRKRCHSQDKIFCFYFDIATQPTCTQGSHIKQILVCSLVSTTFKYKWHWAFKPLFPSLSPHLSGSLLLFFSWKKVTSSCVTWAKYKISIQSLTYLSNLWYLRCTNIKWKPEDSPKLGIL